MFSIIYTDKRGGQTNNNKKKKPQPESHKIPNQTSGDLKSPSRINCNRITHLYQNQRIRFHCLRWNILNGKGTADYNQTKYWPTYFISGCRNILNCKASAYCHWLMMFISLHDRMNNLLTAGFLTVIYNL